MKFRTDNGFTLIELMVVIAIIGLLASVILINLNSAQNRAKKARARAEMIQIIRAADLARTLSNTTLMGVTGNNCSACGGNPEPAMLASLQAISTKSGVPNIVNLRNDPWGGKYYLDENEGEINSQDCRRDVMYASANPETDPDATTYWFEYQTSYCKANPDAAWTNPGWKGQYYQ